MGKIERQNEWAARVNDFRSSGQTAADWCATNNLRFHQLKYWLRRQKQLTASVSTSATSSIATVPTRWLPVEVSTVEAKSSQKTLLIKVGFASIEISPGFDPDLLAEAVLALGKSC